MLNISAMAYQLCMVDGSQMLMLFLFETMAVDTSQTPLLLLLPLLLKEVCTSTSLTTEHQT